MQLHFTISEKKKGEIDTFTFIHTLLALVGHKQTTTKVKKKKSWAEDSGTHILNG